MSWKPGNRSRDGLNNRASLLGGDSEQIQLRIDPRDQDLDTEIEGLMGKVGRLKQVTSLIEEETKTQNALINNLEDTVAKANAMLKTMGKRLDRSLKVSTNGHLLHVILFATACFFCVYLWSKFR
ncbi:protein transport protein SFT1 [Klebsormidium nitens]|uniref:Protein transport protein SFT1 n=1 Tax=Klebsormidium nitens TaxID=105231 RepID=A0A1Y1I2W8_KLENI|nr:protein transport protein SFT1 [Klebsormidium nitens]|eukprot:GAQ83097.1 protein transport protein SFT1 [Klebsormidium nitens]